jgi:hypothetical protein
LKEYNPNPFSDPIKQLESKLSLQQDALDHRLSKLNMKKAWQESMADNVDATHPLVLYVYIPTDTRLIKRTLLRLRLEKFRSYGTGAESATVNVRTDEYIKEVTFIDADDTAEENPKHSHVLAIDSAGAHTHGGAVVSDGSHSHTGGTDAPGHTHKLPDHGHVLEVDGHTHDITHGIYEGPSASDVTVTINGTDRTAALDGPFNTNQSSLDITQYLTATGWNTISLGSATLGRIHATIFVEIYLP